MSENKSNEQPEALASFAQAARKEQNDSEDKSLRAENETQPFPEENVIKHAVATELLRNGGHGDIPDPSVAGVHALRDRITDSRSET